MCACITWKGKKVYLQYLSGKSISANLKCFQNGDRIEVKGKYDDGVDFTDVFDTVVFAVGRDAETKNIGLENVGKLKILEQIWFSLLDKI